MFKLNRWEDLQAEGYDRRTLEAAKDLATEMCQAIFETMGMSPQITDESLRVTGRGLTFIFPLRDDKVVKLRDGNPRRGPRAVGKRGRPVKRSGKGVEG